jgi:hypothetical protein
MVLIYIVICEKQRELISNFEPSSYHLQTNHDHLLPDPCFLKALNHLPCLTRLHKASAVETWWFNLSYLVRLPATPTIIRYFTHVSPKNVQEYFIKITATAVIAF